MFRRLAFLLGVVLLVSAQGFADIDQDQDYAIEAGTVASLLGGFGAVGDGKIAVVSLGQTAISHCGLWALQDDNAIFTQKAFGVGCCGALGILQNGHVIGCQFQLLTGLNGSKLQGQQLEVGLTQQITKADGAAAVSASQGFIADRMQVSGSPSGSMSADQFANVGQDASINGVPCSDAAVTGGIGFSASQVQADN